MKSVLKTTVQSLHILDRQKWAACKSPRTFRKFQIMISMSCNFTNLYKVFFLNDFIDLKVFFGKWHKVGTHPAIYKGRFSKVRPLKTEIGQGERWYAPTPRNLYENQVSIRSAVAQVTMNAKGLKSLGFQEVGRQLEQEKPNKNNNLGWCLYSGSIPF